MNLVHWVVLYNSLLSNLHGSERNELMEVIEDDVKFDQFMVELDRRRARLEAQMESQKSGKKISGSMKPGRRAVSQDEFLEKMGTVMG